MSPLPLSQNVNGNNVPKKSTQAIQESQVNEAKTKTVVSETELQKRAFSRTAPRVDTRLMIPRHLVAKNLRSNPDDQARNQIPQRRLS